MKNNITLIGVFLLTSIGLSAQQYSESDSVRQRYLSEQKNWVNPSQLISILIFQLSTPFPKSYLSVWLIRFGTCSTATWKSLVKT